MQAFKFIRTMQYTEVIEVQAETYAEARELAEQEDGVRNHDDTVVEMQVCI